MRTLYLNDYSSDRRKVTVWCVDAADGVTPETGEASGQPKISKNGGSFSNTSATLVALDATTGLYQVTLTAAELDTLGRVTILYKSSNTAVFSVDLEVTPNPFLHDGTAQAGTSGTITLASTAEGSNDNAYDNAVVWIVKGTGAGQMRGVSVYVASTKVVTVDQNWTTTPSTDSVYVILPSPKPVAATDFADALLNRNVAGGSSTGRLVKWALYRLVNKVALSSITSTSSTMTVYGTDDSTSAFTATMAHTSGTNPITSQDP